jgi:hypothetical protein
VTRLLFWWEGQAHCFPPSLPFVCSHPGTAAAVCVACWMLCHWLSWRTGTVLTGDYGLVTKSELHAWACLSSGQVSWGRAPKSFPLARLWRLFSFQRHY